MDQKAYLVLQDGTVMEGKAFGAVANTCGETVFTTGMTGYLETLTDPSYYGQIVVQTFPLVGNYGVIPPDFESSKVQVKGYIVREWCHEPSNFRCQGDLDAFLQQSGIPGIYGIDTRRLTKLIRRQGVMNGKITQDISDLPSILEELRGYTIQNAVDHVTCQSPRTDSPEEPRFRVVLMDFGAKENIRRSLVKRGCEVLTLPAHTPAGEVLSYSPDGIMLSNGPGDQ